MAMRITDAERRARLVARQHLGGTASGVEEAVRAMVALHSSDPVSPFLAARARVREFATSQLESALYDKRGLWRLHAMRRTLFVVPYEDAAILDAAVGRVIAGRERARLEKAVAGTVSRRRLGQFEAAVMQVLGGGEALRTTELAEAIPGFGRTITVGSGNWTTQVALSSRLLYVMAMEGRIVRTRPVGSWRSSQYRWSSVESWFGDRPPVLTPQEGRARLAARYLEAFGPATMSDIRWWTGWPARDAAPAVAAAGVIPVVLADGTDGFVVDNAVPAGEAAPAVSFLPALDSTPMGWKERGWFLGSHEPLLFDRNGNAGPTVWLEGRIVGGWGQRSGGEVGFKLLEDVGSEQAGLVEAEAAALTTWLGGTMVTPRFRTPIEQELAP